MRGVGLPSTTRGGEGIGWPIGDDDFVVGLFRGNEREVDAGRLECGVRDVEGRLELRQLELRRPGERGVLRLLREERGVVPVLMPHGFSEPRRGVRTHS